MYVGRSAVKTVAIALTCLLFTVELRAQALISPASDLASARISATTTDEAAATRAATNEKGSVPKGATFKAAVDMVALNVVVTDGRQKFVTGLAADNFAVYEDGVQQDLSFFAATSVPLDLALLLDTSASMTDKMQTMQEAAIGFASTLRAGDRITVVEIKDNVRAQYPLGGDFGAAIESIRRTTARGGTALHNGLYLALKEMMKQRRANGDVRRQAIAVLSDGEDTASLVGFDDVMALAKESGVAVYTITLKSSFAVRQATMTGRRYFSQSEFSMKALAQETGARSFFPTAIGELAGVYGSIAEELSNQYAIGYTSKNGLRDGAFRRVIVRIADHPEMRTRTRSGYIAARADRATTMP
jgi:Ca-activated chloride channel family protein